MSVQHQQKLWSKYFRTFAISFHCAAQAGRIDELQPSLFVHSLISALCCVLVRNGFTAEKVRDMLAEAVNVTMKPTNEAWKRMNEELDKGA